MLIFPLLLSLHWFLIPHSIFNYTQLSSSINLSLGNSYCSSDDSNNWKRNQRFEKFCDLTYQFFDWMLHNDHIHFLFLCSLYGKISWCKKINCQLNFWNCKRSCSFCNIWDLVNLYFGLIHNLFGKEVQEQVKS